jgi:iron complex transport system ATP-binding protein
MGRALMARPKLLILDEACAGLDPSAREHFLQFLQRLGRQKSAPTIVFVTHHVEEVMPFLSHVLILRQGRILAAGARTETLTSSILSRAFAARVDLERRGERHFLRVGRRAGRVV